MMSEYSIKLMKMVLVLMGIVIENLKRFSFSVSNGRVTATEYGIDGSYKQNLIEFHSGVRTADLNAEIKCMEALLDQAKKERIYNACVVERTS